MAAISVQEYLVRRGYRLDAGSGAFLRRMFFEAWVQPGFHRFWRLWNPLYGYFLYRLYVLLGGNRRRTLATLAVFLACGFVLHDLPVGILRGRVHATTTAAFGLFGLMSLCSAAAARPLKLERWPRALLAVLNLGLVAAGLIGGARLQRLAADLWTTNLGR